MKQRSVAFYKRLIIFLIGAAILLPTGLAIILASGLSMLDGAELKASVNVRKSD